jgi:endonuclease/exonuclease/phosphatase (EEP) superfamily protein YafD
MKIFKGILSHRSGKKAVATLSFLISIFILFPVLSAYSHPGGVDSHGGHRDGLDGGYHFHQGPLAGNSYSTKEQALNALNSKAPVIRLASFNIRVFSDKSRDDKELEEIVSLLKDYDIVAIQELRDTRVLARTETLLSKETGTKWAYEASKPVGHGVKELYAFLYRKDRISIKEPGQIVDDDKDIFIREPYYATFQAGQFDFTLITIHALYESKDSPGRKIEFDALARELLSLQDQDPNEQDIILVGDFNDSSTHERFRAITEIPGMTCLIQAPLKTTISDTSLYDNICFQRQYLSEYKNEHGVVRFDETMFEYDDQAASKAVSDHRPVWAVFGTDKDDD